MKKDNGVWEGKILIISIASLLLLPNSEKVEKVENLHSLV